MSLQQTPIRERADKFYIAIGKNFTKLRKSQNLSQEEFGNLFGLSRVAVVNIESGKQRLSVFHYAVICDHFNADLINLSVEALSGARKKSKLEKQLDRYKEEVFVSGLTEQQKQGAELVFIGIYKILFN